METIFMLCIPDLGMTMIVKNGIQGVLDLILVQVLDLCPQKGRGKL